MVDEAEIIVLDVVHGAAHAGVAFAEAEVVGGIGFGRFPLGPVPVTAVLEIDDVDGVAMDDGLA